MDKVIYLIDKDAYRKEVVEHLTQKDLEEWVADEGRLLAIGKAKLVRGEVTITADRIEAADEFNSFKAQGNAHIVKGKE